MTNNNKGLFLNSFVPTEQSKATTKATSVAVFENVCGCDATLRTEFRKKSVSGNAVRFAQLLPYKLYQLNKLDSKDL